MNRLPTLLFGLLSLILAQKSFAQDSLFKSLLNNLERFVVTYPQEKVHVHTDKPYYVVGEDIWLKAYLVTAEKNEPSQLSKVLYIDLLNEKNEVKKTAKLEVKDGFAHANISLFDSLKAGRYNLIAYTNYMRNYSTSFFFDKIITIGDVANSETTEKLPPSKLEISLKFFPEGGSLVEGIRSKIGIKALLSDGFGVNLSGYIINSKNEKIIDFSPDHAGMGITALTPMPLENYTAVIVSKDGVTQEFKLPETEKIGYVLSLNNLDNELLFRVSASPQLINGQELFAVAQNNGKTYKAFAIKVESQSLTTKLEKRDFPTGITQFTLFDNKLNPIAERLVFVNHKDQLKIDIGNTNNAVLKTKANLVINVKDLAGNSIDGNFSVSVADLGQVPFEEDDEKTILSNLLLTSDLKGYIEKPNYYFNSANPDKEQHLDYLLLTQGWSRFVWTDVASNKDPEITFRPEQTLEIIGKITNNYDKPLSNAKVSLFSTTQGLILKLDSVFDTRGNFVFDRLDVPENSSFILKAIEGNNNKDIKLQLNRTPLVNPDKFSGNSVDIAPYITSTKKMFEELVKYNMLNNSILLNTVEIKTKLTPKSPLNIPNSKNASGSADQVITEAMLKDAISIYSPFLKASGVIIKDGILFRTRGTTSLTANPPMLLILDGVQINQDLLPSIPVTDVAGIEILTSNYNLSVLGPDAAGGAIYITSKSGALGKGPAATNTAKISGFGFQVSKQFYSPNYDDPNTDEKPKDLRSTIYWNPNINTDITGKASFSFFNASTAGTYRVVVEGMDAYGNLGRKVFNYEVK